MYQLTKPIFDTIPTAVVKRLSDNAFIPFDLDNTDYIAYLEWCKENTPLPADEVTA